VSEFKQEFRAICAGATTAAALALVQHVALWEYRDRIPLAGRYTLGVAAVGAGVSISGAMRGRWAGVVSFWCCAGTTGVLVASLHWWRIQMGQPPEGEAAYHAGFAAGQAQARRGTS
jgi:hypothetical protein